MSFTNDDGVARSAELIHFLRGGETTGYGLYLKVVLSPGCPVGAVGSERVRLRGLIDEVRRVDGIESRGKGRSTIYPLDDGTLVIEEGTNPAVGFGDDLDLDAVTELVRGRSFALSTRDVVDDD